MNRRTYSPCLLMIIAILVSFSHDPARGKEQGWRASPKLVSAQNRPGINYDESKVPDYTLPNPLKRDNGTIITDPSIWRKIQRPHILELFRTHVYGRAPLGRPADMTFKVFDVDRSALGGLATRKQVTVYFNDKKGDASMDILMYIPNARRPRSPLFLGLNFYGNHSIHSDPGIKLSDRWMRSRGRGIVNNRATEASRGGSSSRWPLKMILGRGYGVATIYYGDIDPDYHDEFKNGVHALFDRRSEGKRSPEAWGSIGAWAWGLSRGLDYLETDANVDRQGIIVMGHSRLGKTSLWAGAEDKRFAIVISNNSGCGGAALNRRCYGETVKRINTSFPHWFCENFKKYNDKEDSLPVDQHSLLALIAPRPVYVASADEDLWADPRGEFLTTKHADPVYTLLGTEGLSTQDMPGLNISVQGTIGYHVRKGKHDVTDYDWQCYMDFADKHLKKKILSK